VKLVLAAKVAKTRAFEFDAVGALEVPAGVIVVVFALRTLEANEVILGHKARL
jgi:hypothetical protein